MPDRIVNQANVKYKKLFLFFVASSSLIVSGALLAQTFDFLSLTFLIYCNLTGVFLVYRLNDCIDHDAGLKLNLHNFFGNLLHKIITVQFVLILIPIAFFTLNKFSLIVLTLAGMAGTIYSLSFHFGNSQFRIKNVFILKNILIGIAWGSLILIGAGSMESISIFSLFIFASVQVVVGSIIRDVPDFSKDKTNGVNSFPVVLGMKASLAWMHLLNAFSFLVFTYFDFPLLVYILFLIIVFWRSVNISFLSKESEQKFWSQTANLMTCVLILFAVIILKKYESFN